MIKEYKFDRRKVWKYFYKIILITFSAHILTTSAILIYHNASDLNSIIVVFSSITAAWLIFFMLPLSVLFLNHRKYSKSIIFGIKDGYYSYKSENISFDFRNEDIIKVELCLSPPSYDERIDFLYFGKYHLTTIHTKKNKAINISCLVFDDTKEVFREELIMRKKKLFPIMKNNNI